MASPHGLGAASPAGRSFSVRVPGELWRGALGCLSFSHGVKRAGVSEKQIHPSQYLNPQNVGVQEVQIFLELGDVQAPGARRA